MKKLTVILLFLLNLSQSNGQQYLSDTIGHYYNGQISYEWPQFKMVKSFENRIIRFQTKYPSGRIAQEFSRYNNSSFLFTAYYEFPDSSIQFRGSTFGIIREGLVQIVAGSRNDTIMQFDPETYEEYIYFDSLLLPIGKWTYYFPNGMVRLAGNYFNHKREGTWLMLNRFGTKEKTIQYVQGTPVSTQNDNHILEANVDTTRSYLKGIWRIGMADSTGNDFDPNLLRYKFLDRQETVWANNDKYIFKDDCISLQRSNNIGKEQFGSWDLPAYNLLEITLNNQTERYQIEYLSAKIIIIRKNLE